MTSGFTLFFVQQVNIEFGLMYKNNQDNFITKWRGICDAIIKIGNKEYPAVRDLITSFEDGNSKFILVNFML